MCSCLITSTEKVALQLPLTTGLPSAGPRQRVWQLGSGPWNPLRGQGGEMVPGGRIEAFYSLLRQKANPSACFRLEWRKGSRHACGLLQGTSIASESCATLCLCHSVPSLQIFAATFPQVVGIFSMDSTLCPWSMAEPRAKSPACSKS